MKDFSVVLADSNNVVVEGLLISGYLIEPNSLKSGITLAGESTCSKITTR